MVEQALTAAAAADSGSGGSSAGWSLALPVSQPSAPPFQCVALIERILAHQADLVRAGQEEEDEDGEDAWEDEEEEEEDEDERQQAAARAAGQCRSQSPSCSLYGAGRQPQPASSLTRPRFFWALRTLLVIDTDARSESGRQSTSDEEQVVDDDREYRYRCEVSRRQACSSRTSEPD